MKKTVAAVIVGAGSSARMKTDKMMLNILGQSVIERTVRVFSKSGLFDEIILVTSKKNEENFKELFKDKNIKIVLGGETRAQSVLNGVKCATSNFVMIHDGARPLVTVDIIKNVLDRALEFKASACAVKCKDSVKTVEEGFIKSTVKRESIMLMQTPQCFEKEILFRAYEKSDGAETDDCEILEKTGAKIKIVEGSYENIKLTTKEDILVAESIIRKREGQVNTMRVGTGFDTHQLTEDRPLIIGGVKIPYEKGLLGHSDADVLIHAVIDALFGAAALGDIGTHFPDKDEKYKGISSMLLLKEAGNLVKKEGYGVENIDTTIIIQSPKMAPYIDEMRKNISCALDTDISKISIKAKTNEKMGFTGRGEGVEARATVLLGLRRN